MAFKSFAEIEKYVSENQVKKKVVLAGSGGRDALESLIEARKNNIVEVILIGNKQKTEAILKELGEDISSFEFVEAQDDTVSARLACEMVVSGRADIPMKGNIQTSVFMKAILDKSFGFVKENGLISQATVFEFPKEDRLMIMTDCAVNISPDYNDKKKILQNAVTLAKKIGIEESKVAVIAPVEVVNPAIPSTLDAALIEKAYKDGLLKGCIVEGPMAFDIAVSKEAAIEKGVSSKVSGNADILLLPDLCCGNALTKSLTYFSEFESSGCVAGTARPVIMTSRTDTEKNKYNSILMAVIDAIVEI